MRKEQSEIPSQTLIDSAREWISKLCKTGGKAWSLRIPPDFEKDPDMVFGEICRRIEHWEARCNAAEEYIEKSPCDPDIRPEQLIAYRKWRELVEAQESI